MVSIIIPMYNVEKKIIRTIESILKQKLREYEIIIVDDCSLDNSYNICEKYIKENKINHIKLIKNDKNYGPSYTRNKGIKVATGEYAVLLDADDYYEERTVKKMQAIMEKKTLVITGIKYLKNNKEKILLYNSNENIINITKNEVVKIYTSGLLNQPSNKMYDFNFIKENNISFNENSSYGEDLEFNLKYIKNIDKIKIVNEPLYVYTETKNGLNSTYKENELKVDKENFDYRIKIFKSYFQLSIEEEKELYRRYIFDRIRLYHRYKQFDKRKNKKEYLEQIIREDKLEYLIKEVDFSKIQRNTIIVLLKIRCIFLLRIYIKLLKMIGE